MHLHINMNYGFLQHEKQNDNLKEWGLAMKQKKKKDNLDESFVS